MANSSGEFNRKLIPASLVYLRASSKILMVQRTGKNDYHYGKWNGLGGKLEPDESPLQAARRELKEESGIDLPDSQFKALGVLHFPNFKKAKSEDWVAFVFTAELQPDHPFYLSQLPPSPDGTLHWVQEQMISGLELWAGDHVFMPYILSKKPIMGTFWYDGNTLCNHWIQELA